MIKEYGTWKSPITSDLIVAEMIGVGSPALFAGAQYWVEARPREAGRNVIVRRTQDGRTTDMTPAPFNVRTRVHEYGGGAWWQHAQTLYFCHFADQQIYQIDSLAETTPTPPRQLTHTPHLRFADGIVDASRHRLICVVEDHSQAPAEPENYLAAVDLSSGAVTPLSRGHDFYAAPALSADGTKLAWITWNHPDMPWDGTELWQASVPDHSNDAHSLLVAEKIAGSRTEAVQQPRYAANGQLHFISDRSGWWNLYRHSANGEATNLWPMSAEFGEPQWVFGPTNYQFVGTDILCCYSSNCVSQLALLHADGSHQLLDQPYTDIGGIHLSEDQRLCTFVGASATTFSAVICLDLASGQTTRIKSSCDLELNPGYYALPQAIDFPSTDGDIAHGFYYPPTNKDFQSPEDSAPPLVVELHGGPTSATHSGLNLRKQYWTSRGFAVLDVNYRGSTGYGRAYRDKLKHQWGIVDVDDTVFGAQHLVDQGLADAQRLAIKGGSAGGYTTLAALALRSTFKAGASYYGVGDLEALAKDTHKFESRYLDSLIGEYPRDIKIYQDRSPINHIDQLDCPVIFFQGLEDKVVPPNQAQEMVAALENKGIPVAYVPFEGEQHGFRQAENIKRALDLELYFYGRIFGFVPADSISPINILNLDP
ncbi:prolyl oligopeptidase family serine peptidase [Pseudomonadales bacterium]|nr:prolyl oligopeptidase family serine peptidase [Pseudomonadales bacterium]